MACGSQDPNNPERWEEALDEFARRARGLLGDKLSRIILYGSRARGDFEADSDLDLLVVVPEPVGDCHQWQHELREALASLRPVVDAWIMGRLRFEEEKDVVGGLAYPATHDGRLVYAKP